MKNTKNTNEFPNYLEELIRLFEAGKINRDELRLIDVQHDEWCGYWIDGRCDCWPAIVNSQSGELLNPVTD